MKSPKSDNLAVEQAGLDLTLREVTGISGRYILSERDAGLLGSAISQKIRRICEAFWLEPERIKEEFADFPILSTLYADILREGALALNRETARKRESKTLVDGPASNSYDPFKVGVASGEIPEVARVEAGNNDLIRRQFLEWATKAGASRETVQRFILETGAERPKWRSDQKPKDLRHLSSIQFMLRVYDDLIEKVMKDGEIVETIVYKDIIRRADRDLMNTVEVYLNSHPGSDPGEAEGITFVSPRPSRAGPRQKRKNTHRPTPR